MWLSKGDVKIDPIWSSSTEWVETPCLTSSIFGFAVGLSREAETPSGAASLSGSNVGVQLNAFY